jgi:hypothetical protein
MPLPRCPHSLIPKDTIKRTSCTSRWVVHEPPVPFHHSDIDGLSLQSLPLPRSSSSICSTWHTTDCWCCPCPDPFLFKERKKRKENVVIKLLSPYLNYYRCWLFAIYLITGLIHFLTKIIYFLVIYFISTINLNIYSNFTYLN